MGLRTLSIQVALPTELATSDGPLLTGMLKQPVEGPIELGLRALAGDGCAHTKYHGHEDQAVCVYVAAHFKDLATELELPTLGPGSFGDNFTVTGGDESSVRVGEVYRVGSALVEVTKPREPCHLLNEVNACNQVAASLGRTARTGWYLRVLEPGTVQAGDVWRLERAAPAGAPTIAEAWRAKSKA
jgi:MOSC domain-containing protein YiiM